MSDPRPDATEPVDPHPAAAMLRAWVLGDLEPAGSARVERHLEACDECAAAIERIDAPVDPLVRRLREVTTNDGRESDEPLAAATLQHADRNLLLGAIALQAGVINARQLADACLLWAARDGAPLADVLIEQGAIDAAARASIEALLKARVGQSSPPSTADTLRGVSAGDAPAPVATGPIVPIADDRHQLERLHSTGGIGQVWLAHDTTLGRRVALKELLPELRGSRVHRERFYREACVAAQLAHPGTTPIYEYREESGRCYYTMKFLAGRTYAEAIREAHAGHVEGLPFERLYPLLEQFIDICDAIAYAHAEGIVHRDLKGDNVILGEFGEVTVIDWGLAKRIGDSVGGSTPDEHLAPTIQGERLGTPGYMAPEQARGDLAETDERTDVYGLAAVLYEALTTRPPFSGETSNQTMHLVETATPRPPSDYRPGVPEALEAICLRGLAKEKAARFPSAAALRDAVRGWVANQAAQHQAAEQRAKFFSLSADLFAAFDEDRNLVNTNPAYDDFFGYAAEKSLGKSYAAKLHPDDLQPTTRRFEAVGRGGAVEDFVARVQDAAGVYRAVSWSLSKVAGEGTVYAIGRPLDAASQRRRAAQAREQFFSLTSELFVIADERGLAAQVNEAWEKTLGWTPDDVVGRPYTEFVHPDDVARLATGARQALVRGASRDTEIRMRTKDGGERLIEWTFSRVPGERVNYGLGRDVTARRSAEQRLRAILDRGPEALLLVDSDARVRYANAVVSELFGYRPDELAHRPLDELIPEAYRARHREFFRSYFVNPLVRSLGRVRPFPARRADGGEIAVQISLTPLEVNHELLALAAIERVELPGAG